MSGGRWFQVGAGGAPELDVEPHLEAHLGEMRDVIEVDKFSEGLLAAVLGPLCAHGFGFRGPARWTSLVQRHRAALERGLLDGGCSGQ